MKIIYLLPYKEYSTKDDPYSYHSFRRIELGKSETFVARVWKTYGSRWFHTYQYTNPFNNAEDAKKDLDECLINMGYVLLTEEQADKLKVLL